MLRHLEMAESTWNRWRSTYGGMKADAVKRLKELEAENARLKKLLAEAELDEAMLKELAEGKWCPRIVAAAPLGCCRPGSGCHGVEHAGWWASGAPRSVVVFGRYPSRMRSCGAGSVSSLAGILVWGGARPTTWCAARDGR